MRVSDIRWWFGETDVLEIKKHCVKYARIRIFLTRIFPYNERIFDFVFIREHGGQRKPVFWHIVRSGSWESRTVSPVSFNNQWNIQYQLWFEISLEKKPALVELPETSFSLLGRLLRFHYIILQGLLLLGRGFSDVLKIWMDWEWRWHNRSS